MFLFYGYHNKNTVNFKISHTFYSIVCKEASEQIMTHIEQTSAIQGRQLIKDDIMLWNAVGSLLTVTSYWKLILPCAKLILQLKNTFSVAYQSLPLRDGYPRKAYTRNTHYNFPNQHFWHGFNSPPTTPNMSTNQFTRRHLNRASMSQIYLCLQ